MYQKVINTVTALVILGITRRVESQTKLAFKKGRVDAAFGDKCLRTFPDAEWMMKDATNFGDSNRIYACSRSGCKINENNGLPQSYESPLGGQAVMLKLIPKVQAIHANTYTCETDPLTVGKPKFVYDLTVYEDKLDCSSNVTQHKAGETVELSCGITAWGNGKADLKFKILDKSGQVESEGAHETFNSTQITMKLKLEKSHHGKQLQCSFSGFDGEPTEAKQCIVNDEALDILYAPEFQPAFDKYRLAKAGDTQALDCKADANPAESIEYLVNGVTINDGASPLELTSATKSLTCVATNILGVTNTTMRINFVEFNPNVELTMDAGEAASIDCRLTQSNRLDEVNVQAQIFVGDEKITDYPIIAKKEWHRKKIVCVAIRSDDDANEYIRKDIGAANVQFAAVVSCSEQTSSTDYFERACALEQNPLADQADITVDPGLPTVEIVFGGVSSEQRNFTIKIKRAELAKKENKKEIVSIKVGQVEVHQVKFNYTSQLEEPVTAQITLIVGLTAGLIILAIVIALLVIFLRKGGIGFCAPKKGLTDSEKGDSNFPSDDGHGQPPATRSMNGYDNKIVPNDDGLVYADLAFSDHQPRSRAPIIDPYSTTDYADIDFGPHPPPYSISDSVG